jgi:hypothetical protein
VKKMDHSVEVDLQVIVTYVLCVRDVAAPRKSWDRCSFLVV